MQVCLLTNRTQNTQHSKCKFSFGHVESLELAMARCRRHRRKWRRKGWRIRARQRRGPMISVFLGSSRDFWMAMVKDDLSVWAKFTLGLIQCASLIHPWVTSSNSSSSASSFFFFIRTKYQLIILLIYQKFPKNIEIHLVAEFFWFIRFWPKSQRHWHQQLNPM